MTTNIPKITAVGQIDAMGIDVGFSATKFTLGRRLTNDDTSDIVVDQFHSHAAMMLDNGYMPESGDLDGIAVKVEGVPYFVGKDIFLAIRGHATKAVSSDYSATTEYKALFLGALSYAAQNAGVTGRLTIKHLVVGLPVSAFSERKAALKALTEGTHQVPLQNSAKPVTVVIENVTVVAQPHGALVASGTRLFSKDTTLVLDMGGGTFDWFVTEGFRPNHQRCGAVPIGMLACATAVCDQIKPTYRLDPKILAKVDEALRTGSTFRIGGEDYEVAAFMPPVMKVLESALEPMLKSVESLDNIDAIVLTGGGAPMLAKTIATRMRGYTKNVKVDSEPVASNARGFHVIAEQMNARRR